MLDKRFFKSVSYLALSNGIHAITYLLFYVLLSNYLLKDDYGEFRQAFLFYEIFSPLFSLGFPVTLYFFLGNELESNYNKTIREVNTIIISTVIGLFSLLYILVKVFHLNIVIPYSILDKYFWLLFYFCMSSALIVVGTNYLVFLKEEKKAALLSIAFMLSFLVMSVIAINYIKDPYYLAGLRTIVYIIYMFCILWYTKSYLLVKIVWERVKKYLYFTGPVFLAGYIGLLSQHTDKIIVSNFFSVSEYGTYINGAFEVPFIGVLTMALSTSFLATFSKYCATGDMKSALTIFNQIAKISSLLIFPTFIFLLFNYQALIVLMFGESYIDSANIFLVYLFLLPIRIIFYGPALISMGKQKVFLYRSIGELILNVILSIIFLKLFGLWGVPIATVISVYFWSVPFNIHNLKQGFKVSFWNVLPIKHLTKILIIALAASIILIPIQLLLSSTYVIVIIGFQFILYVMLVLVIYKKLGFLNLLSFRN